MAKELNLIVQFGMIFSGCPKCNPEINLGNESMLSHDELDVSATVTGFEAVSVLTAIFEEFTESGEPKH